MNSEPNFSCPFAAARLAAKQNKTNEEVAELFNVSVQLAAWRMNATGARIFAQRLATKWARPVNSR